MYDTVAIILIHLIFLWVGSFRSKILLPRRILDFKFRHKLRGGVKPETQFGHLDQQKLRGDGIKAQIQVDHFFK